MSFLGSILGSFKFFSGRVDDDFTDRLHYILTTNTLIALSVLSSFKQFGTKPIECIFPEHISGQGVEAYLENYCWAKNTYFISMENEISRDLDERDDAEISYYQWIPFFFIFEAMCFQIPLLYWKVMAGHSGIRIHQLIQEAINPKNIDPPVRKATIKMIVTHLENAFRFHHRISRRNVAPHRFLRMLNLPYTAAYVTVAYLITKVLYLLNVFLQFVFMNQFLLTKGKYGFWGWGAVKKILNGTDWDRSALFPIITLCDVRIRTMGNLQRFTAQCVLVINIFNEKIFVCLWFWYCVLIVLTTWSLIYWTIVSLCPCFGRKFVSRHMELSDLVFDPEASQAEVDRFVRKFVRIDGIFALRMISMHTGVLFGTDLLAQLWRTFFLIPPAEQTQWSPPVTLEQPDLAAAQSAGIFPPTYKSRWSDEDKRFDEQLDSLRRRKGSIGRHLPGLTEVLVVPANLDDPYVSATGTPTLKEAKEEQKKLLS